MKKISELNQEELKEVFHSNDKLQYKVYEDYQESEMDHISEILDSFKPALNDWSIGFNNYNSLRVKDHKAFLECALDAQNDFCFLSDEWTPRIETLLSKYSTLYNMDYDDKNYDQLENWLEEQTQEVIDEVLNQFNKMTQYDNKYILDYFLDFYAESRMDEDFYVDESGVLFEHVEYERSYR